jgi:hypothetical protein
VRVLPADEFAVAALATRGKVTPHIRSVLNFYTKSCIVFIFRFLLVYAIVLKVLSSVSAVTFLA